MRRARARETRPRASQQPSLSRDDIDGCSGGRGAAGTGCRRRAAAVVAVAAAAAELKAN